MADDRLELPLAGGPIYDDGTYKYFGEAEPGTTLNSADWRVSRMNNTTKQIEWANLDGTKANFDNLFTDVATVAALIYS